MKSSGKQAKMTLHLSNHLAAIAWNGSGSILAAAHYLGGQIEFLQAGPGPAAAFEPLTRLRSKDEACSFASLP